MITKTYSFFKDGKQNDVYTLRNANGLEADILTYGARLIRLSVEDELLFLEDKLGLAARFRKYGESAARIRSIAEKEPLSSELKNEIIRLSELV